MPYLEVSQGNEDEIEVTEQVVVPNIEGLSIKEAEKIVKELGLEISVNSEPEDLDRESTIILQQIPKEGVVVNSGSRIYVEY